MESKPGDEALNRHPKRSRTQIPSTSVVLPLPSLPPELNTEILSRLPVKSLLQCRCVSKSWLAFISTPQFTKTHLSVSANNKDCTHHRLILRLFQHDYSDCILKDCSLRSLLYESVMEESDFNYPMKDQHKRFLVVGSINGLICLANGIKHLFLLNPSTRAYKKLPDFGCEFNDIRRSIYGFGYDECSDDYKVVACVYHPPPHVEIKIYSLKSDSWRSIGYPEQGVRFFGPGKLVNGKLHWANNVASVLYKGWNIISFDLADEKWEKVEHPRYGEEDGVFVLGVLENNLSVISNGNHPRTDFDVWVMKEYGVKESWTKMFTFKCALDPMDWLVNPPCLVSKKGEISVMFGGDLFLYNPNDESITYREISKYGSVAAIYLESLVSPLLRNEGHAEAQMDAIVE